jgi:hypothetical protein
MMDYKNIIGKQKSGWEWIKARRSQFVAADVSRRSGYSRANFAGRGPLRTTGHASIIIQNPPTHVGGYGAMRAGRAAICDAPNRESSIAKSLISRAALRNSLISRIGLLQVVDFHDISTYFQCGVHAGIAASTSMQRNSTLSLVPFHNLNRNRNPNLFRFTFD